MPDDQAKITSLLNLYAIVVDARRWEMMSDIFVPDVQLSYFGVTWRDLASFQKDFASGHADLTATQHFIGNHLIQVKDDRAAALSFCHWTLIRADTVGGDNYSGGAWYEDLLVRTVDDWRIEARTCGLVWTQGNPAVVGADRAPACEPLHLATAAGRLRILLGGE